MPIKDGFEATQEIRAYEFQKHREPTVIVALTASVLRGSYEKCIDAGMNDFLYKPVEPAVILETIQRYVSKQS